jgi:site-specific recombinase XerC
LLKVTGEHRDGFRDHVIFSLALGTALREHEIAALDVGDILHPDGRVRRRFPLRTFKRSTDEPARQDCYVPDGTWHKLTKFVQWKRAERQSLAPDAPLFVSRLGQRIAKRTLRYVFRVWQQRAGFDYVYNFHSLRHTALTNLYREKRDIRLVNLVARHKSLDTTAIYASPSDDEVISAIANLPS